jgi:hypothetical protein
MKDLNCKVSITGDEILTSPAPLRDGGRGALHRWVSFLSGIFLIFIFVSLVAPWIMGLPYMKPVNDVIQERGIEANLYDYTEVELFADAEFYMQHAMEDSPKDAGYIISIISGMLLFSLAVWIGYKYVLHDGNEQ